MEGISSRCRLEPDLVWWLLHPHPCKVLPWSCLDGRTDRQRAPSLTGTEGSHPVKFGRLINFITLTTLWVSALQFLVLLQSRALAALCCVPSRCRRCNKSLVCSLINTELNVWKGKKRENNRNCAGFCYSCCQWNAACVISLRFCHRLKQHRIWTQKSCSTIRTLISQVWFFCVLAISVLSCIWHVQALLSTSPTLNFSCSKWDFPFRWEPGCHGQGFYTETK